VLGVLTLLELLLELLLEELLLDELLLEPPLLPPPPLPPRQSVTEGERIRIKRSIQRREYFFEIILF
jgi:hypothetical protein